MAAKRGDIDAKLCEPRARPPAEEPAAQRVPHLGIPVERHGFRAAPGQHDRGSAARRPRAQVMSPALSSSASAMFSPSASPSPWFSTIAAAAPLANCIMARSGSISATGCKWTLAISTVTTSTRAPSSERARWRAVRRAMAPA
ncbi:hypothetical protein QQS45_10300 [Alteriqipengyuania flavescens]|nr:hypothetical protein [Alteriqipengyuania flavescens]WJY18015.1 hypothetical protein QQW98_10295 [Alteriqipengyuania flavescens]WJY23956.1 hypothetical protein QQS45_10300 [Alteriqipengyuania flavescens]